MQIISGFSEVLHRELMVSGHEHVSSTNEIAFSVGGVSAKMRTREPIILATGDRIAVCGEFGKGGVFNAYALMNYTRGVSASCAASANEILGVIFIIFGAAFAIVGVGLLFVALGIWLLRENKKMKAAETMLHDPHSRDASAGSAA
ncbi:hypothetical protein [Brevundimonas sp.]|uniref:hypothetical protein n=1 Tax=Brevundimonas sp. TaxID=1871086 RepID=UPI0025BA200D|nr:hypothetical protein [Brevundimonas sp.]